MYTKEKGIRDIYKHYCDKCELKNHKPSDYKTFGLILKEFNILLREKVLSNETVRLPYNLGYLGVIKFENKYDPEKQYKWRVDYKKSKELGYIVYYGEQYGYRWKWHKASIIGKRYYNFKPCRQASRLITIKIKEGVDYYSLNNINFAL